MSPFQIISNWITSSYPKHVIAQHLAKVALNGYRGLDALYPQVKIKAEALIIKMSEDGKQISIIETFRTINRQDSLSSSVTNASGLKSYHQYGLSFDVMFKEHKWSPPSEDWWTELGEAGEALGLIWGGRWKSRDMGHFEWHGTREEFTWEKLKPHFE